MFDDEDDSVDELSFIATPPKAKAEMAPAKFAGVEVPLLKNKEEFEFLPGRWTVSKVLGEVKRGRGEVFNVRLQSGDTEKVNYISIASKSPLYEPLHGLAKIMELEFRSR